MTIIMCLICTVVDQTLAGTAAVWPGTRCRGRDRDRDRDNQVQKSRKNARAFTVCKQVSACLLNFLKECSRV
jgi:hypothetical protein